MNCPIAFLKIFKNVFYKKNDKDLIKNEKVFTKIMTWSVPLSKVIVWGRGRGKHFVEKA